MSGYQVKCPHCGLMNGVDAEDIPDEDVRGDKECTHCHENFEFVAHVRVTLRAVEMKGGA